MSIQSEITRLTGLRNRQRTKLTELKLVSDPAEDLDGCTEAIEGITSQGGVKGHISDKDTPYTIPAGYHDGTGSVDIASAEATKLIPENIKSGITVLGVEGSYAGEGVDLQEKTATPTKSSQEITPDDGYEGLSKVTVEPIPETYQDVSGVTATAADVLANKTIVTSDGTVTAGTMQNNGAVSATIDGLTTESYTVPEGYHSGSGTVSLTDDIETALAAI